MSFNNVAAEDLIRSDTAIVWSLRTGESILRPAVRPVIGSEQGILLLQTKPWLLLCIGVHQSLGFMAIIELVGTAIPIPSLAKD